MSTSTRRALGFICVFLTLSLRFRFILPLECLKGWYGVNCSSLCVGHCRDNSTCNHVTGLCDGCDTGWTGTFCEKGNFYIKFSDLYKKDIHLRNKQQFKMFIEI